MNTITDLDIQAKAYGTRYIRYATFWSEAVSLIGSRYFGNGDEPTDAFYVDDLQPIISKIATSFDQFTQDQKVLVAVMLDLYGSNLTQQPSILELTTAKSITTTSSAIKRLIYNLLDAYPQK